MPFRPIAPPNGVVSNPPSQAAAIPSRVEVRARSRPVQSSSAQQPKSPSPSSPVTKGEAPQAARKHHKVDRSGPNWENGDYIVGKGRPPKASQWQPNQSGNPNGPKRREKLDPQVELDNAILNPFATLANGVPEQTNLGLFALNMLKGRAAQKDRKAAEFLLELYCAKLRAGKSTEDDGAILPEEQAMIDALLDAAGWAAIPAVRSERKLDGEEEADDE